MVWCNGFGATNDDVYAQRVDASGALVGNPIPVANQSAADIEPVIAYSAALDRYLVVWRGAGAQWAAF